MFPDPPLVSYKRQKNIRESIIRAKVAPSRTQRKQTGMKKCGKCVACSYILEAKSVKGTSYKGKPFVWKIGRAVTCDSKNTIYLVQCDKDRCRQKYIGMTKNFRDRICQHIGYIRN